MSTPNKIKFTLVNGISEREINDNKYAIYAHSCREGVYVGMTDDPVKRWQEHLSDSSNKNSPYYNDPFRAAIRKCRPSQFTHYIVAVANFEKSASDKEASAINFYGVNLNVKPESITDERDYGFRPLDNQIGKNMMVEKKSREGAFFSRKDSARKTITAEICWERGRKRLKCCKGQPFRAGLMVECSRVEREGFNIGDKVRVNVALSEKGGKEYLVAAKTAKLVPAKA